MQQLFSAFMKIINVSWAAKQHIRMISEESCDTEDWRKINDILQYIQIDSFTVFLIK